MVTVVVLARALSQRKIAKKPIGFVVGSSGEIEFFGICVFGAVAESQRPKAIDFDRGSVLVPQQAIKLATRVERGDLAAAELPDQNITSELSPVRWGNGQSPGRVKIFPVLKAADEVAAGIEL